MGYQKFGGDEIMSSGKISKEHFKKGKAILLSPIVLWMTAFFLFPMIFVIIVSFLTRGDMGQVVYKINLSNYSALINPMYIKILWDSLVIAFFTTVLCLALGYPFAYFIARSSKKIRPMLLLLLILPFWTNSLVRTYAWIILLRGNGVINSYLMKFGIIHKPLSLLYNNGSVLLGMVYMLFPFMVLPLYASIEKLDSSILEAASDLGANRIKSFVKVTVPLTKPGIVAGCLLVFVPTLGYFFIPDLMGGSKVMLICNLIKNEFLTARNWPFGAAISVVLIILMFIFIGIYIKLVGTKDKTEVF